MPLKSCLRSLALGGLAALVLLVFADAASAQFAHHPFAVGGYEGAVGHQNRLGAWILGWESTFYLKLTGAVRATKASAGALAGLVGISFAYGVFHAAGPGHGKAVITSYMVSNERALRRGLVIAALAAVLQGLVATVLVGVAALVFHATAGRMTAAAQTIEFLSYCGIVLLGSVLVWRKGRGLVAVLRPQPAHALLFAGLEPRAMAVGGSGGSGRFRADDGGTFHQSDCDCGHLHMPDPTELEGVRFDLKAAALAVVTAGLRPCSGAILVLVFALAQGVFAVGVAATFAMSIGTALTTAGLATVAVLAKDLALRLSGPGSARSRLFARLVEFGAAAAVLLFGLALLSASLAGSSLAS